MTRFGGFPGTGGTHFSPVRSKTPLVSPHYSRAKDGVGLYSARIDDPKVYTHFYDDSVRMSCDRGVPKHTTLATDRLQSELIMHLMHALGIITWWQ